MHTKVITEFSCEEFTGLIRRSVSEEMRRRQSLQLAPYLKRLKLITANQVAAMAEVSVQTVRNWEREGLLRPKKNGKTEKYVLVEILELISRREDLTAGFPKQDASSQAQVHMLESMTG